MGLVGHEGSKEDSFSEGEPDLEPPEELALGELDEEHQLEEGLDNEDISEEEVDEETLELTLEDLVHDDDDDAGDSASRDRSFPGNSFAGADLSREIPSANIGSSEGTRSRADLDELEDPEELEALDVPDLEDYEEGLDHVLADRLGDSYRPEDPDAEEDTEREPRMAGGRASAWYLQIRHVVEGLESNAVPCRDDEFVCCSCFLVKKRSQLAEAASGLCRDCTR